MKQKGPSSLVRLYICVCDEPLSVSLSMRKRVFDVLRHNGRFESENCSSGTVLETVWNLPTPIPREVLIDTRVENTVVRSLRWAGCDVRR